VLLVKSWIQNGNIAHVCGRSFITLLFLFDSRTSFLLRKSSMCASCVFEWPIMYGNCCNAGLSPADKV